jgi:hypothetical protein
MMDSGMVASRHAFNIGHNALDMSSSILPRLFSIILITLSIANFHSEWFIRNVPGGAGAPLPIRREN